MNVLPDGPHAVLVECATLVEAISTAARLRTPPLDGVEDVVAAARSVLVCGSAAATVIESLVRERLRGWAAEHAVVAGAATVELAVRYDGADLDGVAAAAGLSTAAVVAVHSAATYTVAFCGFAPGFAYLVGLPAALVLPRRDTPRPAVAAGSVAIAGEFSAVYPTTSPGGWHLLGRCTRTLFDATADVPALLVPGSRVRFVPT